MSRLSPLSWRELVQRLRELGFEWRYVDGRHRMGAGDFTV